jgi:hypothetical protein
MAMTTPPKVLSFSWVASEEHSSSFVRPLPLSTRELRGTNIISIFINYTGSAALTPHLS